MKTLPPSRVKYTRKGFYKGCLRRSLLVGLLGTFLIALCLLYAGDTNWVPFTPLVLPHGGTQDMFVRSTGPRVAILVMSNRIDETLCYSVGSAYLSGLPVVVAGYRMKYRGFLSKFEFMERAIENAELQPEDVVFLIDSDTIFTGADLSPFLDRFIAESAATPDDLDALAVRQGPCDGTLPSYWGVLLLGTERIQAY
ncbi:unnamed protein product [Phytomonas sp. EM1]|nr:unnamed protein product [Phytomonas sp. EM1]|eukprot:CCW63176.1 unnamed protein product [Phytomonas sp. isolate EM1]